MFEGFKKRRAIRAYKKKLGPCLEKMFGWRATYKPEEVKRGAYESGLHLATLCYGFAMYCTREDFDAHHAATGQSCDYDAMRREIAELERSDNWDSDPSDGGDSGDAGSDWGDGGDCGGDGGGGGGD
jgi:hypothetical protein